MRFSDITISKWYWFYSDAHQCILMGRAKEKDSDPSVRRIIFNKVVNADGSPAKWGYEDQTIKHFADIIKEV